MKEFIDGDKLCDIFFEWMKKNFGVDDDDRLYILIDFVAPDECQWLISSNLPNATINGETYLVREYKTDLSGFSTFSNSCVFKFIKYTNEKTLEELYVVED